MIDFPRKIDCGDFELIKTEATFDKSKEFFDVVMKNKDFLSEWLECTDYYSKPEDAFAYLTSLNKPNNTSYLIQVNNVIVGGAGFVLFSERQKTAELGYWLAPDFNGRGFVARAIKFLEDFAFEQAGMNRLQIGVDVRNLKSQAVAVRAGYIKEGIRRQAYVLRGVPCDTILYSKLKSEWEKGKVK